MSLPGPESPRPLPWGVRLLQKVEFSRKLGVCDRLFGRALARRGVQWVRTAPGPVWKLDLANSTHRWIAYGCYEGPGLWRWIDANRAGLRTIVDSGANIGQTVLYFAHRLPQARILAYEPGRGARAWLQEGIAANRFSNVVVEAAGLGAAPGTARLGSVGPDDLHGSWNVVNASEGEAIALAALDEELDRHGFATLDLWKLDLEGYELEALRGAARALAAHRIRAVYMEVGISSEDSVGHLRRQGYSPWVLTDAGKLRPLGKHIPWGNALFLAPGHPSAPS